MLTLAEGNLRVTVSMKKPAHRSDTKCVYGNSAEHKSPDLAFIRARVSQPIALGIGEISAAARQDDRTDLRKRAAVACRAYPPPLLR